MSLSIQALTKRVPVFAAVAAALVGLVNIASTLTPNIRWRGHLLLEFEPVEAIRLFHALSLPAGAALLLVAPYLAKRRRRAMQTAVALMLALGVFDLLKGLDFEETILTWGVAVAPDLSRDASPSATIRTRFAPRSGACRCWPWSDSPSPVRGLDRGPCIVRQRRDRDLRPIALPAGPDALPPPHPVGVHMLEIGTLLMVAYVIFRPLARPGRRRARRRDGSPRTSSAPTAPTRSRSSSCAPTATTSSARTGGRSSRTRSRTACCCFPAIPSGPPDAIPGLLGQVRQFADARGLKLGALGASEGLCPLYEGLGLRTIYLGDEAVVDARVASRSRAARSARCASR